MTRSTSKEIRAVKKEKIEIRKRPQNTPVSPISSRSVPAVSRKNNVITRSSKKTTSRAKKSIIRIGKKGLRAILLSRAFHVGFKILFIATVSCSALYGTYAFIGNTVSKDVVVSKAEIVIRVAKHTSLPDVKPDAVVRVQDPDTLKKQNPFYANVKEGDYVLMYPSLAVIYDLRNDSIIAIKQSP